MRLVAFDTPLQPAIISPMKQFFAILVVALLVGVGVFMKLKSGGAPSSGQSTTQPVLDNDSNVSSTSNMAVIANGIFITNGFGYGDGSYDDNNIYQTDDKGKGRIKLTNYPASQGGRVVPRLKDVQIINDNSLGYYRCDVKVANFNCSVFRIEKTAENLQRLVTADQSDLIGGLAFFDANTFVYSVDHTEKSNEKVTKGKIVLFKNGKEVVLREIDYGKYFGLKSGGGAEAGISNPSFSPDGTKILAYIGPGAGGRNGDTFVFDLNGNETARISRANEAQWNDDNTITFLTTDGLYSLDLTTKKEVKLLSGDVRNPKLLKNSQEIVYWVNSGKGEVWLYDMQTKRNSKILSDASHPLWISSSTVMASSNNKPVDSEEAGRNGFTQSMVIYNVLSKEKYKLFDVSEIKGWIEFLSPLRDQGYYPFYYSSSN